MDITTTPNHGFADLGTTDRYRTVRAENFTARSTEMSLMNEALARAHCQQSLQFAEHERLARRVHQAVKADRRASRAAARADKAASRARLALHRALS